MTDNEIIKALKCCSNGEPCANCPYQKQCDETDLAEIALDLINRQQAEIERLNEHYKNLAKASIRHAFDTENDRQLLHEYQNIFLGLGYGLKEVQDPELKEIKSWKDRAIWHVKRCDQLSRGLKAAKTEAVKEFTKKLKNKVAEDLSCGVDSAYYLDDVLFKDIDNLVKEMVGKEK